MEGSLSPNANVPFDISKDNVLAYGGFGGYFTLLGEDYYNKNGDIISHDSLQAYKNKERYVTEFVLQNACNSTMNSVRNQTSPYTSVYVQRNYFRYLEEYGNNTNGTCAVLSTAMLLGYYDKFINDIYVPNNYETQYGTTDGFHLYLNEVIYGVPVPENGRTNYSAISSKINQYLDIMLITSNYTVQSNYNNPATITATMINQLESGRPVLGAMHTSLGAQYDHGAVIYGVVYMNSNPVASAVFTAHMGDAAHGSGMNEYMLNAGFFFECAYITCGLSSHDNETPWRLYSSTHHSSLCHCGETVLATHSLLDEDYCYICESYVE